MAGHSEGAERKEFCSLRKDPCDHFSYTAPCKAQAAGWDKYPQKYKSGAIERSHEAHHVACVAAVTGIITKNDGIAKVVENTKWCVNKPDNMIALPMWGHTFCWYVDLATGDMHQEKVGDKFVSTVDPPPFVNLTQHNYDHG